ncbi:hypothetical protein AMJ74_02900 [candidate division WOR_3 bacterium SM1_77]|jgi:hypothetical protein|uniref:Uncharacterized protein n=1 Tax=candidate division WOR_3 bacterium SM1_77 TaxID=1703778 RepID=A0A0S8K1C6_UNCW3|nr:MAG: hypothetical protein AMJ74_02900 [candidate division WOR_3 bacterium SM1_77]
MKILHANSLAVTLDALNEVFFMEHSLSKAERTTVARWLASRQGAKGAYRGMIAPTPLDLKRGIRLFTGERVVSGAAVGHILGEEASRALILLDGSMLENREALKRSNKGILRALKSCETPTRVRGFYCCGTCTAALWRHLAVGGLTKSKRRLAAGLRVLKKYRDGTGKWHRFPFYYTLLALSEIDTRLTAGEIRYVAPLCERLLKRYKAKNRIARRRHMLLERILTKY